MLVGWLWYLIAVLPVIGIIQVGSQAMADRYTYVPLIGPFLMLAFALPERPKRLVLAASSAAAINHVLDARIDAPDLVVLDASWHLPAEKRDAEAEFRVEQVFIDVRRIAIHHDYICDDGLIAGKSNSAD